MKINPPLFARIKSAVETALSANENMPQIITNYETGNFSRSETVKDLQMRFCFDLWYSVPHSVRQPIMDEVYSSGANDTHLYTALKKVTPTITRRY